jgi:hypothetical protein
LDKQVDKEKIRMHNQPSQQCWFEIDWTSSEHDNSSSSLPSSSSHILSKFSSSSSSKNETPPPDTLEERRAYAFINPILNNGDNSDPQMSQHQLPKWDIQLLKDVKPYERNKIGIRSSNMDEESFSLVSNDFTEPLTFKEVVKHEEWKNAMVDEYKAIVENGT